MILSDNLFAWRSAWGASGIKWHEVTGFGKPTTQVDSPTAAGAADITALRAHAAAVVTGERIRFAVEYSLPGGGPESGFMIQAHGLAGDVYRTVYRGAVEAAGESLLTVDFVWPLAAMNFRPIIKVYGSTELEVRRISVRRVVEWTPDLRSWESSEGGGTAVNALSQPGDLAILTVASQYGNTQARPPEGWESVVTDGGFARSGYVAYKRVTGAEDTVGIKPFDGDSSNARKRALLLVYKGIPADQAPRIEGWQEEAFSDLPSGFRQVLLSQRHAVANAPVGRWAPVGDRAVESGSWSDTASWSILRAGLSNTTHTLPEDQAPQMWARVLLPPALPKSPLAVWRDGVERRATARRMPSGAASVDALLAKKGFVIAHRGGSASWPEMSMRAYTQAVAHGADALELSAQRTSDGVWVGAHDRTLRRVDPSAPDKSVGEMTWAEVQALTTQGEPFIRAEELFAAYGGTHVIFLDPKYSAAQWRELEALIPAADRGRIVWKFSADAGWLAQQWKAAGYKTWGYAYAEHVDDGRLTGWEIDWDILGMEYGATSEQWGMSIAYGKPVIAHICPDKAAAERGVGFGASGSMVSGISKVLPRKA